VALTEGSLVHRVIRRLVLASSVFVVASADAAILRVPSEYTTINQALDATSPGDTVLVAPGHYTDSEERFIVLVGTGFVTSCAFMKAGVSLVSEDGPQVTTIDLAGPGESSDAVLVVVAPRLTAEVLLQGFTVTGAPPDRVAVLARGKCGV
jgi:hypothetical protein